MRRPPLHSWDADQGSDVLDLLAAGQSQEEILADYPYLEPDDIAACLRYAAESQEKTMKETKYPAGWDEERVRRVLGHYETQSEEEAVAEDESYLRQASAREGETRY